MLVGPSKQLKQIIHIEHNIVENPNWPEANQLAIYKRGRGFELGATEKQIQVVARAGLEPGTAGLRVRHSDHSATLPPYLKTTLANILTRNYMGDFETCVAQRLYKSELIFGNSEQIQEQLLGNYWKMLPTMTTFLKKRFVQLFERSRISKK